MATSARPEQLFAVILSGSVPIVPPRSQSSEEARPGGRIGCLPWPSRRHARTGLKARRLGNWLANPLRVTLATEEALCMRTGGDAPQTGCPVCDQPGEENLKSVGTI
jgi:hypothetical protein